MDPFEGKVAIVTGGASGIGRSVCEELGRRKAIVVAADINTKGVEAVAAGISSNGGRAKAAGLDVTNEENVKKLIKDTAAEHGHLDYMFNNAGILVLGEAPDMTMDMWRRIMDVNLWGVIYGTMAAYSLMVKQGHGHIVNTASLFGLVPGPIVTSYTTTKHGVVGLSRSLRAEGAGLGVKVSVVCPGLIQTGIFGSIIILKANIDELLAKAPFIVNPDRAAKDILRGVARNRETIIITRHAKLAWWMERYIRSLSARLWRLPARQFRKMRTE